MTDLERDVRNAPPLVGEMVTVTYNVYLSSSPVLFAGDRCLVLESVDVSPQGGWVTLLSPQGKKVGLTAAHVRNWKGRAS